MRKAVFLPAVVVTSVKWISVCEEVWELLVRGRLSHRRSLAVSPSSSPPSPSSSLPLPSLKCCPKDGAICSAWRSPEWSQAEENQKLRLKEINTSFLDEKGRKMFYTETIKYEKTLRSEEFRNTAICYGWTKSKGKNVEGSIVRRKDWAQCWGDVIFGCRRDLWFFSGMVPDRLLSTRAPGSSPGGTVVNRTCTPLLVGGFLFGSR